MFKWFWTIFSLGAPANCSGFSVVVLIKIVHGDKVYIWRLVPCFYHVLWSEKEAERLKYKVMKRNQGSSSVSSRKLSKLGRSRPNFRAKTRLEMLATQASCWTKVNRVLGKIPNRNFLLLRAIKGSVSNCNTPPQEGWTLRDDKKSG